MTMKIKFNILIIVLLTGFISCSDFLEPEDSKIVKEDQTADVMERNADAILLGIYSRSIQYALANAGRHDDFGQKSIDLSTDLWTADMVHYSNKQWFMDAYRMDDRSSSDRRPNRQWKYLYAQIRDINTTISLIPDTDPTEQQLYYKGEALALRAYYYFQLINLFQTAGTWVHIKDLPGVPILVESSSIQNKTRGTVADVYTRITEDFETAIKCLAKDKGTSKTRVGLLATKALAARAYLFIENYARALELATDVVNASQLMTTKDYISGFSDINNSEWLLGVDVTPDNTTSYASFFSMLDSSMGGYAGLGQYKTIDRRLYESMDSDDVRKSCFGGPSKSEKDIPYQQYKFTDPSGRFLADLVFLRSAEAYYIKAEAEVRTNKIAEAKKTLDIISNARSISGTHKYIWTSDVNSLIDQIFLHKRIELWGEGVAFFEYNRLEKDIDRTYQGTNHPVGNLVGNKDGKKDRIVKWHSALRTLQIPVTEFEGNNALSLKDQNPLEDK